MRLAIVLVAFAATNARADTLRPIEVGATVGAHAFSSDVELGVDDTMDEPGPSTGPAIGARAAYAIDRRFAAEGELLVIPTKDDGAGDRATVLGIRAHARVDLLTGKIRPFLVAGLGVHVLRTSSSAIDNDEDRSYHWGAGVRYALSDKLDVRLDARHLIVPDRTLDGATNDFEVTAGVAFRFGKRAAPPAVIEREPDIVAVAPGDKDGDGLLDNVDQCPTKPEDKDSFEDTDGCPDLDNDGDGIVDTTDKCPAEPESKNDWKDEDGCKDDVIVELTGIDFEIDSAKIDPGSGPLLDLAFTVLRDYPMLHVEISGHTSAEGNAARNQELSLQRAQAVKDYLIKRGIKDTRLFVVGHGASSPVGPNDTPEGRARNRRIEFRILRSDEIPRS